MTTEPHNAEKANAKDYCRKVVDRWQIPEEFPAEAVKILQKTITDPATSKRDRNRAIQLLAQVERMKLEAVKTIASVDDRRPIVIQTTTPNADDEYLGRLKGQHPLIVKRFTELFNGALGREMKANPLFGLTANAMEVIKVMTPEEGNELMVIDTAIDRGGAFADAVIDMLEKGLPVTRRSYNEFNQ